MELVHANRAWHLDISPDNIMIRSADGAPILLDFGASRFELKQHSQLVSALVFKSGYSAPEQYISNAERYGPWTDIYAFAATLYRALSGKRPSEATARQLEDELAPAALIGKGRYRQQFLHAIDWALKIPPRTRPQSIAEWRKSLLEGEGSVVAPAMTRILTGRSRTAAGATAGWLALFHKGASAKPGLPLWALIVAVVAALGIGAGATYVLQEQSRKAQEVRVELEKREKLERERREQEEKRLAEARAESERLEKANRDLRDARARIEGERRQQTRNVALVGNIILTESNRKSADECRSACLAKDGCKAFEFRITGKLCYLYRAVYREFDSTNAVSGRWDRDARWALIRPRRAAADCCCSPDAGPAVASGRRNTSTRMPGSSGGWPSSSIITSSTSTSVGLRGPRWPSRLGPSACASEVTLPSKSLPGKASERTTAVWPTRTLPMSRSSISALTRSDDRSPTTTSDVLGRGRAVSPTLALTCSTVPADGGPDARALQCRFGQRQLGACRGQGRFRPGRRRQAVGGKRLAQAGARLIEPLLAPCLTASRALSTSASLPVPSRRALQLRDRVPRGPAPADARRWRRCPRPFCGPGRLARRPRYCRARACGRRPRPRRHCTRADQLLVVEPHQQIAGRDLVVERHQHLGDAARHLRADADLAAGRLDAAGRRGGPCRLGGARLRLGRCASALAASSALAVSARLVR